jgi:hypothetical protein
MTGSDTGDFIPSQDCVGASLDPSQTCDLKVTFQPNAAGPRQASLVIHQNLPWPDRGTTIAASRRSPSGGAYGPDTCLQGYVWREAVPSDHVCVTPETRTQTAEDNNLASSRQAG